MPPLTPSASQNSCKPHSHPTASHPFLSTILTSLSNRSCCLANPPSDPATISLLPRNPLSHRLATPVTYLGRRRIQQGNFLDQHTRTLSSSHRNYRLT